MMRSLVTCAVLLLFVAGSGSAQTTTADTANGPLSVARGWWRAYALGDTAYLNAHSSREALFTLSTGRQADRKRIIDDASNRNDSRTITVQWVEGAVRHPSPSIAVVTNKVNEGIGQSLTTYLYLAVLEKSGGVWRMTNAQSTRLLELTPRIPVGREGALNELAGKYRGPAGGVVTMVVRDTALVLIDPQGQETRLELIGPAMFEASSVLGLGLLRFVFNRDTSGRIASVSRIAANVVTFPRAD